MSVHAQLDTIAGEHPEWKPWLRVLREVAGELSDPRWDQRPPRIITESVEAPRLAGAVLAPDAHAVAALLDSLTRTARGQGLHELAGNADPNDPVSGDDALDIFLAAVNGDDDRLDRRAAQTGAAPEGMRALARLLPMPYLHACARRWAVSRAPRWSQGYCPVCGEWPAFAEVLGVERTRHLRCGRCGASWAMPVLCCTYCARTDHESLGTLIVDERKSRLALDVCRGCSGYLKSVATLTATPSDEVLTVDLGSVEFDIAAVDRGFRRPTSPGAALGASLEVADLTPTRSPER